MRSQSRKPLLAWDLDNTLFDRDKAFRNCLQKLFISHAGIAATDLEAALQRIMDFDRSGREDRLSTMRMVAREMGLPDSMAGRLWEDVQCTLPEFVRPDSSISEALETLSQSHRFALMTNGASALQRRKLAMTGLALFFEPSLILISSEVGRRKPDREIFEELIRRGRCPAEEILFVGDDPVNDIQGGAAAGLRTCWICRNESLPDGIFPDLQASSVVELPRMLQMEAIA